jgi:glycogen synthase
MTRLLFITENYPPDRGGMSESCDRIVRGLARAGIAADVVHFDRRSAQPSHRTTGRGSLTRVPPDADAAHTINLLWNSLQQTLDLEAVTHVVAFGGTMPLLTAPPFAAWMRRPLVTLMRGNELDAGLFDARRRPILDDAIRRSAAVCTVTTAQASKVAALYAGVAPHVVLNGIDFDLWQATTVDATRAADWRAANVDPSRRVLGLFGHLKSKKGATFFVESLMRSGLQDRFHLLLVGEVEEALQSLLLASPGVAHTVLTTLDRFELIPPYLASDFVVLPSHYDGFPNVLIEAAALGRPLLASTAGGMRDLLTDGVNALLFAPGDGDGCRAAIERAAAIPASDLDQLGAAAAAAARRRCDARDETRGYVEVLRMAQEVFDANDDVPVPRRSAVHRVS